MLLLHVHAFLMKITLATASDDNRAQEPQESAIMSIRSFRMRSPVILGPSSLVCIGLATRIRSLDVSYIRISFIRQFFQLTN